QCAQRPDGIDAEVLVKAPVLRRERRLDQGVGDLFERDRIVVQYSALADLGAVAVEKFDSVLAGGDARLVEFAERSDGERIGADETGGGGGQALGEERIGARLPAAQVKARKKTAERVVAALERLPARGQAGIEPGVDPEPVDHALAGVPPPKPFVHVSGPVSASLLGTRASSLADLPGPE